eukprot:354028-Chlamydomonas_euryale.AAC.1
MESSLNEVTMKGSMGMAAWEGGCTMRVWVCGHEVWARWRGSGGACQWARLLNEVARALPRPSTPAGSGCSTPHIMRHVMPTHLALVRGRRVTLNLVASYCKEHHRAGLGTTQQHSPATCRFKNQSLCSPGILEIPPNCMGPPVEAPRDGNQSRAAHRKKF